MMNPFKSLALLSLLFSFIVFSSCKKLEIREGTPECVETKIKDFEKTACDKGANVKEYTYQNRIVFVFDPGLCGADMTLEVIDTDCNTLGYLGGITGNMEINGADFSSATFKSTIWAK